MESDTRNTSRPAGGAGHGAPPGTTLHPPISPGMARTGARTLAEEQHPPFISASGQSIRQPPADGRKPTLSQLSRQLMALIGEYKEYASYYLGTKFDGVKVSLRNVGVYAALGIVGLIALSAVITTAVVLLLVGSAWGLGVLFRGDYGPRIWLGALLVGLVVLAAIAGGVIFGLKMLTSTFRKTMVNKYEQRKRWQRGQFGRNVDDAAAAAPPA